MSGPVSVRTRPGSSPRIKSGSDTVNGHVSDRTNVAIDESLTLTEDSDSCWLLLKLARDTISSGDDPKKALHYAIQATNFFETGSGSGPIHELAVSLHVLAAAYCQLGCFEEAVRALERSIELTGPGNGSGHAFTNFTGYMQLGDTYTMLGQLNQSISCYESGLKILIQTLGDSHVKVAETCRHIAEAHIQAQQFDEAESFCKRAIEILRKHSSLSSAEEATVRRLMALINEANQDYESALENLVLARMSMIANKQEDEVAFIDAGIGNIYLSLCSFDEAAFAYQNALTGFKSRKGENHPCVASICIRLADLYYKSGKLRECKSCCDTAVRIYTKPVPGTSPDEIAKGLTEVSSIYQNINEEDTSLSLLNQAIKLLEDKPGNHGTIAGIEAQMGVLFYVVGRYKMSRTSFENAIEKLRTGGETRSAFFGILLNQMGLACIQMYEIDDAAELFEEARTIMEAEFGLYHQDTLAVYSNLSATYDALGRVEDAIRILEYVLNVRKERVGTANFDFEEEKMRLAELLKEAGRSRDRKGKSLQRLLGINSSGFKRGIFKRSLAFRFKSSRI